MRTIRRWPIAALILVAACATESNQSARQIEVAGDPAAMKRIGDAALASGDAAQARTFYQRAAMLHPDSIETQIAYAHALAAEGSIDAAVDVLQPLRARKPVDATLALTLGKLELAAHRPQAAVDVLRESAGQSPQDSHLAIALGVALDGIGQPAAAQAAYRHALELDPDSVAARSDLALSLALSGQLDESLALLRTLNNRLAGSPGDDASIVAGNLALVYGLEGKDREAAAMAGRLLSPADVANNLKFYATVRAGGPPSP